MMTILEKIDVLRRAELLREVRTESLARVASIAEEVNFPSGDALYLVNQAADRIFAVVEGEVTLHRNGMEPCRLGSGWMLNTLPALAEGTCTETATAAPGTVVLRIEQQDFLDLMASDFHLTRGLVKGLVRLCAGRT